jgi:membrane protein
MNLLQRLTAGAPLPVTVAARATANFAHHEMTTYSAALAYRGLLALFPFMIFVIALVNALDVWQLFGMLGEWARTAPQGRVPGAIREWMVLQTRERAHGVVLSVSGCAAAWAVGSGARVLRRGLNVAGNIPEGQPAWLRLAVSFVAAPVLCAAIFATVLLLTVTRGALLQFAGWFELNDATVTVWNWLRLPGGFILAGLISMALYRFAPSDRQPIRVLIPGALLAALVWASASLIFSRAVSTLLQFGLTYGSFSAAIVLLIYLNFAASGLLFGAELNTVIAAGGANGGPSRMPRA